MKIYNNKQSGLIKMIIVIVIAIAILSWYGVDIQRFFTSEQAQKNFGYIWDLIKNIWNNFLKNTAIKIWEVMMNYVIEPLLDMLKRKGTESI